MRQTISLNTKWAFSKEAAAVPAAMPENWYWVNLPHTWNAIDGQDGGSDYYRGTCYYAKTIDKIDLPEARRYYLEINGANASASVYWDGKKVSYHAGGYSTWRVDVTDVMDSVNFIVFEVDNSIVDNIYPQHADFTFYGGLYRDVNLICLPDSHFELEYYGTPGIRVTPIVEGSNASVEIEVWTKNGEGKQLRYTILEADGTVESQHETTGTRISTVIENVRKWNGRKDPYLYTARVELLDGASVLDTVTARFGCRSYAIDPDKGFLLNGEAYPLRGVARHQDRWGIGNALLQEHHAEDVDLIMEVGATTVRLAHYQHSQYFYDLCDEKGLVLWAEIPYITTHLDNGVENTLQQMKELIIQNYNHPSIVVWGLSNEINATGNPNVYDNHILLNDLVHEMDKTRLTTMAAVSPCPTDNPYISIPDTVSYNHYFGWYGGSIETYGPWFDKFHAEHPSQPIGCSEYGCEALNWHNSNPDAGDYSEEYQALYHESLIRQLFSREYLWATHCWNMFDFAADARNEGGEAGQNHKGLVTFDRKYKKDAFYAYKAWLSEEPFVHLCSKRYVDRTEEVTRVTVYSNQPKVELFANGVSLGVQEAADHFFYFEVPNVGETRLTAVAGACRDESRIRKVAEPNPDYILVEKGAVLNWWDIIEIPGYASLNTKMHKVIAAAGMETCIELFKPVMGHSSRVETMKMLDAMTALRMVNIITGMMRLPLTKEMLMDLNAQLNKIPL